MDLKNRIMESMKAAMKDRDKARVAALRLIRDGIQKEEINRNTELDDDGVIAVLSRLTKQRQESAEAYRKGGREDLASAEEREIEIVSEFLPAPLTSDELQGLVKQAVEESAAGGPKDMGAVMKALKGRYEGRASGKEISEEVKRQLAAIAGS